ncbi:protein of unknown function [Chitinophaga terrae (ex Kim and Jung 2007)]|uniref:DUF4421 domain-containing protein n=1 Tax=Chitinophaga terrae (ex Kim and Jung 2007) TaxID=408074 RepID=A0A1H4FXY9_9BACT|nr:DUF4421 domain-containing protein [Chitinophaga terrae (ex Kim and Jung 2007)]MDQ0108176.1 hypothetical protein [Chitinophaga terrae (ex Kim and Jung 2007)]GEP92766.1 hypothetical protein CTE07_44110 [Chitinophaga terrae (ex Kim and Jung 2007)]SEB01700.1 protein of unknown function [Chitinophaga terrae (ex Kim and Jung 2007)]
MNLRYWIVLLLGITTIGQARGQGRFLKWLKTENDTAYIADYTEDITFRLYGSRKYTKYDIIDRKNKTDVLYRPNTPFNVGFGANYRFLGINIGFNLPFINRHNDKYGKTKYIDLQSHIYLRKIVVDFYGQYYKGYYIANPEKVFGKEYAARHPYPQRPDLRNIDFGLNVQYVFNDKRFSYRAPNLQNEYQHKSAGSLIVGGEIFLGRIKGDSSLIPPNMQDTLFLRELPFYKTNISSLAANVGYAYTFVLKQHFFLSLSLTAGLGGNATSLFLENGEVKRNVGIQFSNTVRASMGYNSHRYFAGVHYVGMATRSGMAVPHTYQTFGTGNFRVSLVRRFALKKPLWNMKAI